MAELDTLAGIIGYVVLVGVALFTSFFGYFLFLWFFVGSLSWVTNHLSNLRRHFSQK